MKPQTTSQAIDDFKTKLSIFLKPIIVFFQRFLSLFKRTKKQSYPFTKVTPVVLIKDDEEFMKAYRDRESKNNNYLKRLSRYQGQKKFVKTGANHN